MRAFTPQLQLETLFVLDAHGRIRSTREPNPSRGPAFALVRDKRECAWAVHVALPSHVATAVEELARGETGTAVISDPPRNADAYLGLIAGRVESGPVFTFPPKFSATAETVVVTDLPALAHHFRGWTADEIPERSPIVGLVQDGRVVSVCFCARRTKVAAEAGVETAAEYRGRGLAAHVTAEWARLIQESRRLPLYSTSWTNAASLAVARKLALVPCAANWNIYSDGIR